MSLTQILDIDQQQQAIHQAGGGVLSLPSGLLQGHFIIQSSHITYRGAGVDATRLENEDGYAGHTIQSSASYPRQNITFEDMSIAGSVVLYGAHVQRVTFRRVRFPVPAGKTALILSGCSGVEFDHCEFASPGDATGRGISISNGSQHIKIHDCRFDYLLSGVVIDSGDEPHTETASDVTIDGCRFIFDWWTLKAIAEGEATYTATSLTDPSASFSFPALEYRNVRAMPVKASGTMAWSAGAWVSDAAAQFITDGVLPGDIVRTPDAFAIVLDVETETRLRVDEWRGLDTYRPVKIVADTPYTVFGVLTGKITSYTATEITVDEWRDLYGQVTTPADDTHYEVITGHAIYPVSAEYAARRVMVRDCYVRGAWGDQLSLYGPESTITGNTVLFGRDMGMTVHGDRGLIRDNRVEHSGSCHILASGVETLIAGNHLLNSRCWNTINLEWLADITASGDRARILANTCHNTGTGLFGVVVDGAQDVTLRDNVVTGHSEASLKLMGGATAEYADNYFDNDVVVV